jgi:hypothetical protein
MIKSEKKLKELSQILDKDSNIVITKAIDLLRQETPFEGAIGLLTALYDKTTDYSIRKTISDFMNDLKDQTACDEVIIEIRKDWNPDTISMLVSSCWQSGLNYAGYSADLAKVFLNGDYVTAVECLTVIEESVHELTRSEKNELIKILTEGPATPDEKKVLAFELISILK